MPVSDDLLLKIIAQDQYKADLAQAREMVAGMTDAEKESVQVAGQRQQAEQQLRDAIAAGGDATQKEAQQLRELDEALASGKINADQYAAGIDEIQAGMQQAEGGGRQWIASLVDVQAAVSLVGEAIGGLKQVWDFAKEGAQNIQIAESFDRTAKKIGGNADEIIAALDKAAHGTIDDENLMQASTRALTLGVAQNGDDLVKVMQLSRSAALAFGGDTASAFETINYAIGNLTPRALKQFGIIVNLKQANEEYAKANGLVVSTLTEEEQRQALLNAVLEQGQRNFGDISNAATTTAEKMKAVETRLTDIIDQLKEFAATGVGAGLDIIDSQKNALEAFSGTAGKLKSEVASGEMSARDYNDALQGMANSMSGIVAPAMVNATLDIYKLNDAQAAQLQTQYEATRGNLGYASSTDESSRAAQRAAEAQRELQSELISVQQGARNQSETYTTLDAAMESTTSKANLLAASQKIVASDMSDLKTVMAGALQNELTNFNDKQTALEKKAETLGETIKTSYGKAKQAAIDNLATVNQELDKNAEAHDKATKKILFDYAEQQLAVGGLTDTEAKALDALAVKWGLKSQSDIAAMQAIRDAAAGLAKDGSIGQFTDNLGAALDKAEGKVSETQQSIQRATAGIAAAGIPIPVKADTSQAEKDVNNAKDKITNGTPAIIKAQIETISTADIQAVAGDSLLERQRQVEASIASSGGVATAATGQIQTAAQVASQNIKNTTDTAISEGQRQSSSSVDIITSDGTTALNSIHQTQSGVMSSLTSIADEAQREMASWIERIGHVPREINIDVNYHTHGTPPQGDSSSPPAPPHHQLGSPLLSANAPYIVGETGAELFIPPVNGSLINNNDTSRLIGLLGNLLQAMQSGQMQAQARPPLQITNNVQTNEAGMAAFNELLRQAMVDPFELRFGG